MSLNRVSEKFRRAMVTQPASIPHLFAITRSIETLNQSMHAQSVRLMHYLFPRPKKKARMMKSKAPGTGKVILNFIEGVSSTNQSKGIAGHQVCA
jgi:hypothetical protein